MKILLFVVFSLQMAAFAKTVTPKKDGRKVAQAGLECQDQAGQVALGIGKALVGNSVTLERTVHLETKNSGGTSLEIYNVFLKARGISSAETTTTWMIQLYSTGSGCMYHSATLEDAAG